MPTNTPSVPDDRPDEGREPTEADGFTGLEADVFRALAAADDELLSREIAALTEWEEGSVRTGLSRLQAKGHLERRPDLAAPNRYYYRVPDADRERE